MRTVTCQQPGRVVVEDRPSLSPGTGEILLDLSACGLCGTDLVKIARGSHRGSVLGHELIGTIAAIGQGVEGFSIGERIVTPHHVACGECRLCLAGATTRCQTFQVDQLVPGGFSDQILVRPLAVRKAARGIPDTLSDEAAIFLEPAACVLRSVDRSDLLRVKALGLQPSAAILGGGSMGLLHLLVLRALVPDAILIVSEPDEGRRQRASELGATAVVAPAELGETVRRVTDASGVDAVFDTVGHPALLRPAVDLLREGGSLVLFAHFSTDAPPAIHDQLFHHERRVLGTYSGSLDEQNRVFDLLERGSLEPQCLVTHRVPLQQFDQALELARDPRALKILLVP